MAVTHPTVTRTALAETIRGLANTGSDCCLIIGTSSLALPSTGVLCIINLSNFSVAASSATTSASSGASGVATGTGTAAIAIVSNDRSSPASTAEVFRGAVGVGSGEVQISSTSIVTGDTVTLTSNVVYTAPA